MNAHKALNWAALAVALTVTISYFWIWDLAKNGFYALTALGLVAIGLNRGRLRLGREEAWLFVVVLFFFAAPLLSNFVNGSPHGGYGHIESHYGKVLSVIPLFYLFRHTRLSQERIWLVFAVGAFSAGCAAIADYWFPGISGFWIIDEFDDPGRASGNANSIMFAIVALGMTATVLAGVLFSQRLTRLSRGFLVLSGVTGILGIALAETRAVWLAVPVMCLVILGFYRRHLTSRRELIAMGLLIAALFVAAYQVPIVNQRVDSTIAELTLYLEADDPRDTHVANSVGIHLEIWRAAVRIFAQHPIVGVGNVNFSDAIDRMSRSGEYSPVMRRHHFHAHNQYLTALAFWGLCGLVAVAAALGYPAWLFFKRIAHGPAGSRGLAMGGLLTVIGYMFCGLTDVPLEQKTTIVYYTLTIAMLYGSMKGVEDAASVHNAIEVRA